MAPVSYSRSSILAAVAISNHPAPKRFRINLFV
jgi:hypothetical protein